MVPPYQLVQVEGHELEHDAQMIAKVERRVHSNDSVIMVPLSQMLKDFDLNQRLSMEPLFVPNDLNGNLTLCFMVRGPNDLTKGSFANDFQDFIAVAYVISGNCKTSKQHSL